MSISRRRLFKVIGVTGLGAVVSSVLDPIIQFKGKAWAATPQNPK